MKAPPTTKVVIFDAYGTLLDVDAAARAAALEPGGERLAEIWPRLSANWRQKQLQYTWLRAVMNAHTDFWQITQDSLDWALDAEGLDDPALRARLLALYRTLEPYPEVRSVLRSILQAGVPTGVLSNGSPDMLNEAFTSAGLTGELAEILSVEKVGVFKPSARVYDLVGKAFGTTPDEVLFVSSNGWDAAGAAHFGFRTSWVNRAGLPIERLPARPSIVLPDLTEIPKHL